MAERRLTPERLGQMQECFEQALELSHQDRETFLGTVATADADLAGRVRGLLSAHLRTGRDLKSPVSDAGIRGFDAAGDRWIGARVGVYQIVRRIGEGGMGTVYEATRADDQYRKRVAIKLLRQQAAGETALQRFRDERQILANLDHPNIASLLDGGVTPDHQPYFVMEYLEGEPITRWCDARSRTVSERLRLFEQVCAAVQYAHQSLVVHRDLKPGNILVTTDGTVKLLDFGIAKLLRGEGQEPDQATQVGARAYTPDYASPEQLMGLPVGTRSDVYALGVVLYELLVGTRPFALAGKSAGEVERLVSEVSPTRPSAALSEARAAELAERTPAKARGRLAGDLDAIVLKALRKEPERRYGSVEEFAGDVRRHLEGRPVSAQPERFGYRLGKLVRRHRAESVAIGAAVVFLVGGVVATSLKAREAIRERERATEVKSFLTTMLGAADPASFGKDVKVREVLDSAVVRAAQLAGQPELEADIRVIIGGTYVALGEFELAEKQYRRELEIQRAVAPGGSAGIAFALSRVSGTLEFEGRWAAADSVLQQATALFERFALHDRALADHLDARGRILIRLGKMSEAERLLAEALDIQLRILPVNDSAVASSYANLAVARSELGRHLSAESLLVQAVASAKRAHGPVHPLVAAVLSPLATVQAWAGANDRADSTFRETLAMRLQLLGPEHREYAWTMFNYADFLMSVGRNAESAAWCRKVLALRGKSLTDEHPAVSTALGVLGRVLGRMDSLEAGERALRESWEIRKKYFPPGHFLIWSSESILGEHLILEKRFPEAEVHLVTGERELLKLRGEDAPIIQDARKRLVQLYEAWGKPAEAEKWRARLKS